jgi:hypothetical protein
MVNSASSMVVMDTVKAAMKQKREEDGKEHKSDEEG